MSHLTEVKKFSKKPKHYFSKNEKEHNTLFYNLADESTIFVWFWMKDSKSIPPAKVIKRNEENSRIFDEFKNCLN